MLSNILRVMVTIFSAFILVLSAQTLLTENISSWGATSMTVSLLLLTITTTIAWRCRTSFFSVAAHLYSTVLVGRLFSTLRLPEDMVASGGLALDPLLLGETGPGVLYIMYLSYALIGLIVIQTVCLAFREENQLAAYSNKISLNDWALTFLRVYVGLMFIAHYSGHVLAGPNQFQVFSNYFSGVGFHIGGQMVVLAGVIEIAVSIGLVFGLMTRIAATGALLYLYLATLWGEHFSAGYIWVLPNGGWEFSALWMIVILVFTITGGSNISIDIRMHNKAPKWLNWCFR